MHVVERVGIRDAFSLSQNTWMWHILAGDMKHTVFSEGLQPLATSMSRLQFWTVQVMNHSWPLHKRFYNKSRYINFLHCCGGFVHFCWGRLVDWSRTLGERLLFSMPWGLPSRGRSKSKEPWIRHHLIILIQRFGTLWTATEMHQKDQRFRIEIEWIQLTWLLNVEHLPASWGNCFEIVGNFVIFCNTFVVGWQAEKTPRNTTDQDRHLVERSYCIKKTWKSIGGDDFGRRYDTILVKQKKQVRLKLSFFCVCVCVCVSRIKFLWEDAHAKNSWQVMRSANFGVNGKGFLSLQRLL